MNERTNEDPPKQKRRFVPSRKAVLITLATIAGLMMLSFAGAGYAGYRYGQDYDGRILPGAKVAGVDVGGMDEDDAVEAIRDAIGPQLDREITLSHGKKTWTVTPRELGAKSNAKDAVRDALAASDDADLFKLTRMRVLGDELAFSREVAITYPRQGARGFIKGIASSYDRDPVDQDIDYSSGWVEFIEPQEGRKVQLKTSFRSLMEALQTGADEVEVAVDKTEPQVTDAYDQVVLVRIGENKLYLYEDGKIVREWLVATGLPEYPTPTGEYEVTLKRYLPTWVNPAPDTWGANMPESIPPGPGNPLGVRAINWDAPAIRFHGTSATYSLGYNASHGCVRMANSDVIELYDLIEVGTPIISIQAGSPRPLYGSSTVVDEETDQEATTEGNENDGGRG